MLKNMNNQLNIKIRDNKIISNNKISYNNKIIKEISQMMMIDQLIDKVLQSQTSKMKIYRNISVEKDVAEVSNK